MRKKGQREIVGIVMGLVFIATIVIDWLTSLPVFPITVTLVAIACIVEIISMQNYFDTCHYLDKSIRSTIAIYGEGLIILIATASIWLVEYAYEGWVLAVFAIIFPVVTQNVLAYYVGKKMLPKVKGRVKSFLTFREFKHSPNKFLGVTIFTSVLSLSYAVIFAIINQPMCAIVATLGAIFATVGDWLESRLKRLLRVKDSGELLRNGNSLTAKLERTIESHGGFLDRFDALVTCFAISIIPFLIFL